MQLHELARGVLDHFVTADDVGVFEAHLAARAQSEILRRRRLQEIVAFDEQFVAERHLADAGAGIFGVVDGREFLDLAGREICDDDFDRTQHGQAAQGAPVQVFADGVLQHGDIGEAVVFGDADVVGEGAQGGGRDAAPAQAGDGRQARIIPAVDEFLMHKLEQLALAHDGVTQAETGELELAGQDPRQVEVLQNPVVKRAVDLEFQGADGVGDAFEVVAEAVGEVIHRVDAPSRAGVVVLGVADAVEHRVAQPDVRRRHVDLRPKGARAVGKLAVLHADKQVQVLRHGTVAEGTFPARPIRRAAEFIRVLRREVAHVRQALPGELERVFVELVEIVGGVKWLQRGGGRRREARPGRRQMEIGFAVDGLRHRRLAGGLQTEAIVRPTANQPVHVLADGIDILDLLLGRVGVVHAQIAAAAELAGDAEIQADGLGVADVQVAVRLRREARVNLRVLPRPHVLGHDVADKIRRRCRNGGGRGGWARRSHIFAGTQANRDAGPCPTTLRWEGS